MTDSRSSDESGSSADAGRDSTTECAIVPTESSNPDGHLTREGVAPAGEGVAPASDAADTGGSPEFHGDSSTGSARAVLTDGGRPADTEDDSTAGRSGSTTASGDGAPGTDEDDVSDAELRARVEETYDFEDFGPQDMAEMSPEEWEAAFDPDAWITGEPLLDRVETDLERRVAERDVFAVVERRPVDGSDTVLAYSDEGYALVRADGSVEGFGTVLRDVKPTVALCSMDSYEPAEAPAGAVLPNPEEVPEGSGELGNLMLQVIAAVLGVAGLALLVAAAVGPGAAGQAVIGRGLMIVLGLFFLTATGVLFFTVANARLSDKFRAEEYRERLRAIGLDDGERPDFLPIDDTDDPGDDVDPAHDVEAESTSSERES